MRVLIALAFAALQGFAQQPLARIVNPDQLAATKFYVGDRFEIQLSGVPNQPVSVRTSRSGRTDWGPVIGRTDSSGRFSTSGQFEKSDFGDWSEVWTVGGKLANPSIRFSVEARCLPGGQAFAMSIGMLFVVTCDTSEGRETFASPSSDSFRTPDGRVVPGPPAEQTQEQYHSEILENFIGSRQPAEPPRIALQSSRGGLGDETSDLITRLIGVNALSEQETRNVLALMRSAFDKPETIAPGARQPIRTLALLRHLAESTDDKDLKSEIAEAIAYFQTQ